MTGLRLFGATFLAGAILALVFAGLPRFQAVEAAGARLEAAKTTACKSCDNRHARLADLRAGQPEKTE
jgi:hypothetical protein